MGWTERGKESSRWRTGKDLLLVPRSPAEQGGGRRMEDGGRGHSTGGVRVNSPKSPGPRVCCGYFVFNAEEKLNPELRGEDNADRRAHTPVSA
jgi:hypothetical protein